MLRIIIATLINILIFTLSGMAEDIQSIIKNKQKYQLDNSSYSKDINTVIKTIKSLENTKYYNEGKSVGSINTLTSKSNEYIVKGLETLGAHELLEKYHSLNDTCVNPERVGDPSIYIFISSSIPGETLSAYSNDIKKLNGDAIFVMRGLLGDGSIIKPTLDFITELNCGKKLKDLVYSSEDKDFKCDISRVDINPLLFRLFNIEQVPAVVWSSVPYTELMVYANSYQKLEDNQYISMSGDLSLTYILDAFSQESNTDFEHYINKLKDGYYKR